MAKDSKTTDDPKVEVLPADPASAMELASQRKVVQAVYDRTHDKQGNPIPIVEPQVPAS